MTVRISRRGAVPAAIALLTWLAGQGCAPAFQDARLVGKGRVEVMPNVSAIGVADEGESAHVANNFGVHVIAGVHERVDLGFGFARMQVVDEDEGVNLMGFGAKAGLVKDRVALAIPFGFAVGEGVDIGDSFQFHPAVLFTAPISPRVDFNPAVKVLISSCEGCDVLLGFNLGLGIKTPNQRVNVRPEFALVVNPGESGVVWSFGVGVSIRSK
jgi:hypothetical protein